MTIVYDFPDIASRLNRTRKPEEVIPAMAEPILVWSPNDEYKMFAPGTAVPEYPPDHMGQHGRV